MYNYMKGSEKMACIICRFPQLQTFLHRGEPQLKSRPRSRLLQVLQMSFGMS